MALSLTDQYDAAVSSWANEDFDLLSRMLTSPDSVTFADQRTVAEKLGFKNHFLKAAVNIGTDPLVWISFFLSHRFPTAQYLKGTVPHRFIGAENEFTGLSSIARSVEGFFRGTNVPGLKSLVMKRQAEVMQVGNKIFDELLTRPNWQNEMPVVSLLLEGQAPQGATSDLYNLASKIRGHMDELWGFLSRTQKVSGGFDGEVPTRATSSPFPANQAPRYLRDYLPHIPLFVDESVMSIDGQEALKRFARNDVQQAIQLAGEDAGQVWSPDAAGRLSSHFARYQSFMQRVGTQVFNPRLFPRLRSGLALESAAGRELFVTDLNVILQKYIHSVSRTYALNAPLTERERLLASSLVETPTGQTQRIMPSAEPAIVQIINEGLGATGAQYYQRRIAGTNIVQDAVVPSSVNGPAFGALRTLVRAVRGDAEESEILYGNIFSSIRNRVNGLLGRKDAVKLEQAMSAMERGSKDRQLTNEITSYFYASTLGLNPSATIKNLFQPFLTTAPAIGLGPTLAGYKVLRERLPGYFREFIQQKEVLAANPVLTWAERLNLAQEKAFHLTFPELAANGIRPDPRAFELSEGQLIEDAATGKARFHSRDAYFKVLLQPFTQAEMANQVVSFYGGKEALRTAARQGVLDIPVPPEGLEDYLNFQAGNLVNATQFRPGPGTKSILMSSIPAPLRMFLGFPMRLGNYIADSTIKGALTEKQLQSAGFLEKLFGGRNYGTVARMLLLGRVMTQGMRDVLGVDMGDALGLQGPFTGILESGRLFAPLTMAPLPSVIQAVANYASTRDVRDIQPLELPVLGQVPVPKTLVPGGLAITRAVRALRQFRPDLGGRVDDEERLMYQGDSTDMVMAALGIPLEKDRRLRQIIDQTQANRARMREYKRAFAVANRNYDVAEQSKLQAQYAKEFPDVAAIAPLTISFHDQRRYQEQARLTAAQRMINTLGHNAPFMGLESILYDVDPDLVAQ